jgi:WD40 repeat protein
MFRFSAYSLALALVLTLPAGLVAQDEKKADAPKPEAPKPAPAAKAEEKKPEPPKEAPKPAEAKPEEKKPEPPKDAPKPEEKKPETPKDAPKPEENKPAEPAKPGTVSFMKDVAPLLVKNCIACHNPRKSESKYVMTTFAQLAKGGQQGEDITLEPGDPDASYFIELIRHDGSPRMPWKQDPMPLEQIAMIETWVKEGAKYDGNDVKEDWPTLLHKRTIVPVPDKYPTVVPITALAFSPNGESLTTGGFHEAIVWNLADGAIRQRIRPLQERIYDLAYSADGAWLATASGDPGRFGTAKLWKAKPDGTAEFALDLGEASDATFAIAFSPDSKKVAAAGADRTIRVWNLPDGKLDLQLEDHADWILDLNFSPDGTKLVSASRDKTTKVFDVVKKESLVTFPGHNEPVFSAVFSADGKEILSAGADRQVRAWKPEGEASQVRNAGGFGGEVFKLALSPDGKSLLAASADKTVRALKAENLGEPKQLPGQTDWVYSLAVSKDGKKVAAGGWDGRVIVWNAEDAKPTLTFIAAPGLEKSAEPAKK